MKISEVFTNSLVVDKSQSNTILDLLNYWAQSQPQKVAFTFLKDGEIESEQITFSDLAHRARCIANCLQAHAIQPGDRALLLYPSGLEFIVAFLDRKSVV